MRRVAISGIIIDLYSDAICYVKTLLGFMSTQAGLSLDLFVIL